MAEVANEMGLIKSYESISTNRISISQLVQVLWLKLPYIDIRLMLMKWLGSKVKWGKQIARFSDQFTEFPFQDSLPQYKAFSSEISFYSGIHSIWGVRTTSTRSWRLPLIAHLNFPLPSEQLSPSGRTRSIVTTTKQINGGCTILLWVSLPFVHL